MVVLSSEIKSPGIKDIHELIKCVIECVFCSINRIMYHLCYGYLLILGKILNAIDEREDQYIDILIETQQACILSVVLIFVYIVLYVYRVFQK